MRPKTNKVQKILADKLEQTARQLKTQTQKMAKRAYEAEGLFQMVQQLQSVESLNELYSFITEILSEMFGARKVVFLDYEKGKLIPKNSKGIAEPLEHSEVNIDDKTILSFHDYGDIIRVSDIKEGPLLNLVERAYKSFRFKPSLIINKFAQDNLINVIFVGSSHTLKKVQEDDVKMLSIFIDHATRVFQNLKLISSLREEKGKITIVINSMSDGLIYTDTELNIFIINPRAVEMLSSVERLKIGDNIFRTLEKFESDMRIEEVIIRESGAIFHLSLPSEGIYYSVLSTKVKDDNGKITGMMLILEDVSEERYAESLKSIFMSTVSHKLRTPLTIIREGVSLLRDDILGELNPKQKSAIEKAFKQTQHLSSLISSLLEFTKTQADIMTTGLRKERGDINEFLSNLVMSMKGLFESKKISVSFDMPKACLNIPFDKDRLKIAIGNILDNAIKFNPEGTKVSIALKQDRDFVIIRVADNGIGIPKNYLGHIFESFTQADTDFTGQIKGMGLGLYMSHLIIKAHDGELSCESTLGKGTEFVVMLPVV